MKVVAPKGGATDGGGARTQTDCVCIAPKESEHSSVAAPDFNDDGSMTVPKDQGWICYDNMAKYCRIDEPEAEVPEAGEEDVCAATPPLPEAKAGTEDEAKVSVFLGRLGGIVLRTGGRAESRNTHVMLTWDEIFGEEQGRGGTGRDLRCSQCVPQIALGRPRARARTHPP